MWRPARSLLLALGVTGAAMGCAPLAADELALSGTQFVVDQRSLAVRVVDEVAFDVDVDADAGAVLAVSVDDADGPLYAKLARTDDRFALSLVSTGSRVETPVDAATLRLTLSPVDVPVDVTLTLSLSAVDDGAITALHPAPADLALRGASNKD